MIQATDKIELMRRRPPRYASAMRWGVDLAPRVGHPLPRTLSRRGQAWTWSRDVEMRVGLSVRLAECKSGLDWLMAALGQAIHE